MSLAPNGNSTHGRCTQRLTTATSQTIAPRMLPNFHQPRYVDVQRGSLLPSPSFSRPPTPQANHFKVSRFSTPFLAFCPTDHNCAPSPACHVTTTLCVARRPGPPSAITSQAATLTMRGKQGRDQGRKRYMVRDAPPYLAPHPTDHADAPPARHVTTLSTHRTLMTPHNGT